MSNHDEFLSAYHAVRRDVERFALFVERDRDRAADLVYGALYNAFISWDSIRTAQALKAYCISAALKAHRHDHRRQERFVRGAIDDLVLPSTCSPENSADAQLLRDAIACLPDIERIPLILAEIEGWPLAEIARELDLSLSAVKMRVKRGRDRLRQLLTDPAMPFSESNNE